MQSKKQHFHHICLKEFDERNQVYLFDWYLGDLGGGMFSTKRHSYSFYINSHAFQALREKSATILG